MKTLRTLLARLLAIGGLFLLSPAVFAQYTLLYSTNDGAITLTGYTGNPVNLVIPDFVTSIGGDVFDGSDLTNLTIGHGVTNIGGFAFYGCIDLSSLTIGSSVADIGVNAFGDCIGMTTLTIPNSVTNIEESAFECCPSLTNLVIPKSVISIGAYAFYYALSLTNITIGPGTTNIGGYAFLTCPSLTNICFAGNAPSADSTVFAGYPSGLDPATAYHLPGTTGWGAFVTNTGIPAVLWNPTIQASPTNFGIHSDQFGFTITGTTNIPIVVQAGSSLTGTWTPLQSCTLTNGSIYFTDSASPNNSRRFYSIVFP